MDKEELKENIDKSTPEGEELETLETENDIPVCLKEYQLIFFKFQYLSLHRFFISFQSKC